MNQLRFSDSCRDKKAEVIKISLPKLGSKLDPRPTHPDHPHNVPNNIANAPGKLLAPEGSFWKSTF